MTLLRACAVALALALVAGGCGGPTYTPRPFTAPTESQTASPSAASDDETAPTLPLGIGRPSAAAATAYVRHYLDVLGYAARTGDTANLTTLAVPSCTPCAQAASAITAVYSSGGHIEGRGYALSAVTDDRRRGDRVRLRVRIELYAQRTFGTDPSTPTRTTTNDSLDATFVVQWSGATPTVARWVTTG